MFFTKFKIFSTSCSLISLGGEAVFGERHCRLTLFFSLLMGTGEETADVMKRCLLKKIKQN